MFDTITYFIHYSLLLLFGQILSSAFSGVRFSRKNILIISITYIVCGLLQLTLYYFYGENFIWKAYPLITHIPLILLLCLYFHKRPVTVFSAVSSAYICCQPSKWLGLLSSSFINSASLTYMIQILTLFLVGFLALRYLAPSISDIYQKDTSSVLIFGSIPMLYYLFDYSIGIYTDFWVSNNRIAVEFLPLLLCFTHILFCVTYFKEYEEKMNLKQKEGLIHIAIEQQTNELNTLKQNEQQLRILRHDMRFFLNNIAICIEEKDMESAQKMLSSFTSNIDTSAFHRYCEYSTINYVLSAFRTRCQNNETAFNPIVELNDLSVDENLFSIIISNALDNALNAQKELPAEKRYINFMLKNTKGKLLLSVKNPFQTAPVFVNNLPVTTKPGHGYGTQSICYMTEQLGGNCQFSAEQNVFSFRVII